MSDIIFYVLPTTSFETQTRNWKLQNKATKGEAMFTIAFCIADRFQNRIASYERENIQLEECLDYFILKNLKLCFRRGNKREIITFLKALVLAIDRAVIKFDI